MNEEFLMLIITAIVCFFSGLTIGIFLRKDEYQKKIANILDEIIKEKDENE